MEWNVWDKNIMKANKFDFDLMAFLIKNGLA